MDAGIIILIICLSLLMVLLIVITIICCLKNSNVSINGPNSQKKYISNENSKNNDKYTRLGHPKFNKKNVINILSNNHNNFNRFNKYKEVGDDSKYTFIENYKSNNKKKKRKGFEMKDMINDNDISEHNNIITKTNDDLFKKINNVGYIPLIIKEETKIGLNNIGATCYMNATLQCLSHTLKLTNYFLNPKNEEVITLPKNKFSKSFLEVIKRLWIKEYNYNKSSYSPYDFKNIISQMNPLFQGIAANDAKDLVNFILQELHSELNLIKYNIDNNSNKSKNYININQRDEHFMFQNFIEEFKQKHCSIVSDIFFGIIETVTECVNCKQRNLMNGITNPLYLYNFQIINFIIFPLEEIRKMKSSINNIYLNEITIYDCFDYYEKPELMQGDNAMWCKMCKQNSPAYYMTKLYSSPYYFILILNRGKGNIYNVKLDFEELIDIGKYVPMKEKPNLLYKLYAIVTHLGPSSMSGHFIAFCKSPLDHKWYKFNDSQVNLIGNFYNDIHEFGTPYILFYERM